MIGKILTIFIVLTAINGWMLQVNHQHVMPKLSSNVTFVCNNNDTRKNTILRPFLIEINKFKNNKWTSIASLTFTDSDIQSSIKDVITTGHIDRPDNTYIKLHFPVANSQTVGKYGCVVHGLDQNMKPKHIKTEPVVITERKITSSDVIEMFYSSRQHGKDDQSQLDMMKYVMVQMFEQLQMAKNDLKVYINNITTHQETLYKDIYDNITTHQEIIHKDIYKKFKSVAILSPTDPTLTWPAGNYTLWKPVTGCPHTITTNWKFSSIRISTAPGNNDDSSSSTLHLSGKVFNRIKNNNYVTVEMCSQTTVRIGPVWPRGSYCIQVYSRTHWDARSCPGGFGYGFTLNGRHNDGSKDEVINLPNNYHSYSRTDINYCCRDDGNAKTPIILPIFQPFYLFRYGGRCQEVVGMEVSNEWIHTDTGKWGENNMYYYHDGNTGQNYVHKNNPDGSVTNGVTTRICYYTPRD